MFIAVLAVLGFVGFGYWLLASQGTAPSGNGPGGNGTQSPTPAGDFDNVTPPNWTMGVHVPISNDPSTWPTGDRIWQVCHAIALAEGANVAGSVPDRLNNPGDLSDGFSAYGGEAHSGSNVTHFPDKETGWEWLYNKISRAAKGQSAVYNPDMTWTEIAQKYAGDWQNWVNNVTRVLGVTPASTLRQYVG